MVFGTPTMFVDMLAKKSEANLIIDSLKFAITGGAPISPQLAIDMIKSFGMNYIKVSNIYFVFDIYRKFNAYFSFFHFLQLECLWHDGAGYRIVFIRWHRNY